MNVTWILKPNDAALRPVLVQEGEIVTIGRAQLGNDKRISRQQMRLEAQARRLIVTVVGKGVTHVRKDAKLFKMLSKKTYYVLPGQVIGLYNVSLTVCRTDKVASSARALLANAVRQLGKLFPDAQGSALEMAARAQYARITARDPTRRTSVEELVNAVAKPLQQAVEDTKAEQRALEEAKEPKPEPKGEEEPAKGQTRSGPTTLHSAASYQVEKKTTARSPAPRSPKARSPAPRSPAAMSPAPSTAASTAASAARLAMQVTSSSVSADTMFAPPPESMMDSQELVERDFHSLLSIFPDCEEPHLEMLVLESAPQNRVKVLAARFLEEGYPKETPLEKRSRVKAASQLPRPSSNSHDGRDLGDMSWETPESYRDSALKELANRFPRVALTAVRKAFASAHYHFIPALEMLIEWAEAGDVRRNKHNRVAMHNAEPDALLVEEIHAWEEEQSQRMAHQLRTEEAQERGETLECGHCSDRVLFEDSTSCPGSHVFCKPCARKAAFALLESGKCRLACLDTSCKTEFSEEEAVKFLDQKMLAFYHRQSGDLEGMEGTGEIIIEECPFCDFTTIWQSSNSTVFCCQNPRCQKESCILCKQANHSPLRCKEIFLKGPETTQAEGICSVCNKAVWTATVGINTCSCGTNCCHVCNKQISALHSALYSEDVTGPPAGNEALQAVAYPPSIAVQMGTRRPAAVAALRPVTAASALHTAAEGPQHTTATRAGAKRTAAVAGFVSVAREHP